MHQPPTDTCFGWPGVRETPAGPALAAALAEADLGDLDDAALIDAAAAARRQSCFYEARQLAAIGELRRRRQAAGQIAHAVKPDTQAVMELAAALGQSQHRVRARMHLATGLSDRLPQVWQLLWAGRIDEYTAGEVHTETGRLTDPELVPMVEEQLLARLLPHEHHHNNDDSDNGDDDGGEGVGLVGRPTAQIRTLARRLVARAEPDRVEGRFRRRFADRRTAFTPVGDGMGQLVLDHTSAELEAVSHRLNLLARTTTPDGGGGDGRGMDQRRADIALDLLWAAPPAPPPPANSKPATPPTTANHHPTTATAVASPSRPAPVMGTATVRTA